MGFAVLAFRHSVLFRPDIRRHMMKQRSPLPGFGLSMGVTLGYLSLIVLLPLTVLVLRTFGLTAEEFWHIASSPRAIAAYRVTITSAAWATLFNVILGGALAWILVRYEFPGRRILDAMIELPFALPTAVAGIALTTLLARNGWLGAPLESVGIKVAYTQLGIIVAMIFTSLPFVVRTVEPVLREIESEIEESALLLGASEMNIFRRVLLPELMPAFLAGAGMSFARSLGEYGAIIFIAGNLPMRTEIVALLTVIRLEEYEYEAAATYSTTILIFSLFFLLVSNLAQGFLLRHVK